MDWRSVWGEEGLAVLPVLVVVAIISAIGFGLVGVMNTDITHATIQGAISRSYFVTQAGLQDAIVQLKANPLYRTAAYPVAVPAQSFGGGQFWVWVEDYAEDMVQITGRGRATTAGRTVTAEVRAIALVGPPITFGLFGVSTVGAQGANSRTYLAPWQTAGPGVPRGANMGSFQDINFQDNGTRLNAVSETSVDTVTLRDGTFNDWELFGFTSRPVYDPDPSVDATPWILSAFGDIVKAQPETGAWAHSCTPMSYYACLTVQNGSTDLNTIYDLRYTENVRHAYMNRVRRRILPVTNLASAPILTEAQTNNANTTVNQAAGITTTPNDSVYTADEFHCLLAYLNNNPGQHPRHHLCGGGHADRREHQRGLRRRPPEEPGPGRRPEHPGRDAGGGRRPGPGTERQSDDATRHPQPRPGDRGGRPGKGRPGGVPARLIPRPLHHGGRQPLAVYRRRPGLHRGRHGGGGAGERRPDRRDVPQQRQ